MVTPTPKQGVEIVIKWEGWHRQLPDGRAAPYLCPAGVPTIGYGSTYWDDGRRVKMSDATISKEIGRQLLLRQLQTYAAAVDRSIKVPINDEMRSACISLCYNIGTGGFTKSTLVRRINARDWNAVPAAFKMWRNGGGRVLTGLLNRRIDEAALFMRGVTQLSAAPAPSSVPAVPMPTRPADAARTSQGPSWWQQIIQGIIDGLGGRASPSPA